MKHRCTRSKLPVSKANEALYEKAISRISKQTCVDECWPGDIIAMQEQEIEGYRSKIHFLEEELKKTEERGSSAVELVAEGIIADDGLFRIGMNDVLILKLKCILKNEVATQIQEEISKRTGIKVAVFDGKSDIVGIVEHGT